MPPKFYYHSRMLEYDFGPNHPLKPTRLARAVALLQACTDVLEFTDPGQGSVDDLLRVHAPEYVALVQEVSDGGIGNREDALEAGLGTTDDPLFPGMFGASLAYVSGSVQAADDVKRGARLSFGLAGGLHHARKSQASGFCIFNDPAIALHILRERFDRVAYVDVDVHHGDGVQWLWYDDPTVLTCSIHEEGKTLYPGTGFVEETGASFTSINVPLKARTTGDVWLDAFERGILPALEAFRPEAIVLQMGTDPHFADPWGHLSVSAQEWLQAVRRIGEMSLPVVALGGGGYNLTTVPRMWVAACLTLSKTPVPEFVPEPFATQWGMPRFQDTELPGPRQVGLEHAEHVIDWLQRNAIPNISSP